MLSTARVSPFAPILAPRAGRRSLTVRAASKHENALRDRAVAGRWVSVTAMAGGAAAL